MGNAAQALFAALSELPEFAIAQRAEASVNLGAVLLRAHMAEQSVPLLREGLKLAQEAKANRFVATALFNLTAAFVALQRYDDALAYANAAKEAVPQLGSDGYDMQIRLLELMQTIQQ